MKRSGAPFFNCPRRSEEPFVRPASVPARLPSRSRTVTSKRVLGHGPPLSRSKPTLFTVARELLRELRTVRPTPVRLLGVGLTNFTTGIDPEQLGMFDDDDEALETERGRTLSQAVDSLRERFGDRSIVPGPMIRD